MARKYYHTVSINAEEASKTHTKQQNWNYFREMLQVANVDPANRKSTHGEGGAHDTYFVKDEDVLEWTTWLVRNGFNFRYWYYADGVLSSDIHDLA
jgi:hypothetical protein